MVVGDFDFGKIKTMSALRVSQYSLLPSRAHSMLVPTGFVGATCPPPFGQILLLCIYKRVVKPVVVVEVSHIQRIACANPKKLLYTVANPARSLPNTEKS